MNSLGGIAFAAACAYAAWRWAQVAEVAIAAYRETHTAPAPRVEKTIPLPPRIMSMVYAYNEETAQESVAARARELYAESEDWQMVAYQLEQEGVR